MDSERLVAMVFVLFMFIGAAFIVNSMVSRAADPAPVHQPISDPPKTPIDPLL